MKNSSVLTSSSVSRVARPGSTSGGVAHQRRPARRTARAASRAAPRSPCPRSGGSTMPAAASGRRSRSTRCAARSRVVQPVAQRRRVGAERPAAGRRAPCARLGRTASCRSIVRRPAESVRRRAPACRGAGRPRGVRRVTADTARHRSADGPGPVRMSGTTDGLRRGRRVASRTSRDVLAQRAAGARPGDPGASRASSRSRSPAACSSALLIDRQRVRRRRGGRRGRRARVRRRARSTTGALALAAARAVRRSACSRWSASSAAGSAPAPCSSGCRPRYRRRVTRRYLDLPLAWHHRHATGTLLSNANSDVEAAWFPIAPLPFAVGTRRDARRRDRLAVRSPTGRSRWSASPSSRRCSALNVVYSRRMAPRQARAQQLRAEVSAIAHESFDGALVVKTMGREAEETARFAARAGELRDALISVGRLRGLFDPLLEALPSLGTLAVLLVGALPAAAGRDQRRRAGQRRVPVHRAGLPGPGDRLGARRAAAQRRRLGPGPARARPPPATCRTAQRTLDRPAAGAGVAALRRRRLRATTAGPARCCTTSPSTVPAGPHRRAGRPDRLRQVDDRLARRPAGRPGAGAVALDGVDAARADRGGAGRHGRAGAAGAVRLRRHRPRQRRPRTAPASTTTTVWAALRLAQADGFVDAAARRAGHHGRRARHLAVRRPAAAAHPGPGAGRPAPAAGARRRHQRGRPAGGGGDPGRRCASRRRRRVDPGGRLPAGHDRARRRGGLPRARPGGRPRHATPSCWPPCPGYADLVTAYEQAEAEREREHAYDEDVDVTDDEPDVTAA